MKRKRRRNYGNTVSRVWGDLLKFIRQIIIFGVTISCLILFAMWFMLGAEISISYNKDRVESTAWDYVKKGIGAVKEVHEIIR